MRKRPLLNTLIRVAILAIVMIFLVRSRKTLFPARKTAAVSKPLMPGDAIEQFAWLPQFPDAKKENIRTARTHEQLSFGYRFLTKQDEAGVLAFYETQLRAAGFSVVKKSETGELHAENPDRKRALDIVAAKTTEGTEVGVSAVER